MPSPDRRLRRRALVAFVVLALLITAGLLAVWYEIAAVAAAGAVPAGGAHAHAGGAHGHAGRALALLGVTWAVSLVALAAFYLGSVGPATDALAAAHRSATEAHDALAAQHEHLLDQATELEAQQGSLVHQQRILERQREQLATRNARLEAQQATLVAQAAELRTARDLTAAIVAATHDGIVAVDAGLHYMAWNPAMERLFGVPAEAVLGRTMPDAFPAIHAALGSAYARALAGETVTVGGRELRRVLPDGGEMVVWVEATYAPLRDATDGATGAPGRVTGVLGVLRDVTEARRRTEELEQLSAVVRQTDDAVAITDRYARLRWVNTAWERLTGWSLDEVRGRTPGSFLQGSDTDAAIRAAMRAAVRAGVSFTGDVLNYRRDGTPYWVSLATTPIRDASGTVTSFVAIQRDVTSTKRREQQLRAWSLQDALTGLHNRRGFLAAAAPLLAGAAAEAAAGASGVPCLLLYMDLDDFKPINDTFGHDAGDEALVEVAALLRETFRPTDVLARLGGDEFVVLAPHCPLSEAEALRARLLGALAERNASGARRFALGMSVGLAHGDVVWAADEIPDLNALMRAADAALYVEKARKRARVALPGTALVG